MAVSRRTQGFTLVEILIVVVILGILAAIVIPQFTNASESAKASSLVSQLQTIRSQLELYQVQHNGQYPNLAELWVNMTSKTDLPADPIADSGDINVNGKFGPYLQQAPMNSFAEDDTVAADNTGGWQYDEATGAIVACLPADVFAKRADLGISDADCVTK
jgi:general secretion pathway protein G